MIESLKIKNFAIISDIDIEFEEGMNVLLGETGAGKSIIIDALGLLMGNRSDYDKIRHGETKASIEGSFRIDNLALLKTLREEYELLEDDDNLFVVSRTLENSKSTCKINYHNVPQSLLKNIMESIIDIHSQHKNNTFFDEKKQIDYLDLYLSKNEALKALKFNESLDEYQGYFNELNKEEEVLKSFYEKKESLDDLDYLEFQEQEIEKLAIQPNEIEELEDELIRLNSFSKIYDNFLNFDQAASAGLDKIYEAKKDLNAIHDDKFEELSTKFEELYYELDDVYASLKDEFKTLEDSQERIEYLTHRKSELSSVRRKYGRSTEEILSALEEIKQNIDVITNFDSLIEKQNQKIMVLKTKCNTLASALNKKRIKAKDLLEKDMNRNLKELALENSEFKVELSDIPLNKKGNTKVDFLLRANVGSKFLPLKDTASLGETSRINLAYKLVFNALDPVGTIIFDEIDTGISSHVGVLVSKKIRELSSTCQTIIISHLPQMVAVGEHSFFVSKYVEKDTTKTKVIKLTDEEKVKEISKMISGDVVTEATLEAARNLIDSMNK